MRVLKNAIKKLSFDEGVPSKKFIEKDNVYDSWINLRFN